MRGYPTRATTPETQPGTQQLHATWHRCKRDRPPPNCRHNSGQALRSSEHLYQARPKKVPYRLKPASGLMATLCGDRGRAQGTPRWPRAVRHTRTSCTCAAFCWHSAPPLHHRESAPQRRREVDNPPDAASRKRDRRRKHAADSRCIRAATGAALHQTRITESSYGLCFGKKLVGGTALAATLCRGWSECSNPELPQVLALDRHAASADGRRGGGKRTQCLSHGLATGGKLPCSGCIPCKDL